MGNAQTSLLEAFAELSDPRGRECEHKLEEVLLVAICAVISGAESWTSVSEWGRLKLDWLRQHLPFANGIASHDTFGRVFTLLSARQFEACFVRWIRQLCPGLEGQHLAIDGKSVRGSHHGGGGPIHLVSAWSATAGLTLGQIRTADKSNEITAIPELLEALDIQGAIITMDAMGCQHNLATQIVQGGADYVLAVKDNQPGLAEAVRLWFDSANAGTLDRPFWADIQTEKDHGRIETRRCVVTNDVSWLPEQGQHWIRCGDAPQNFAILRRIALNLLKGDTRTKLGIANKRLKAGWDVAYLSRLLGL